MKAIRNSVLCLVLASSGAALAALAAQQRPQLPAPSQASPKPSRLVPRPPGAEPKVPDGFKVAIYADNLPGARWMEFAPNGDLFVSSLGANNITVVRDTNNDGTADTRSVYVQGPAPVGRGGAGSAGGAVCTAAAPNGMAGRQPMGMAFQNGFLYVGYTDCVVRYKYSSGDTKAQGPPEKLLEVPGGGNHFARNLIFSRDGKRLYVSVGSASNNSAGEDPRRAAINEYNPDGTGFRTFASGLRNPQGLAWQPGTNVLWTAVNERDNLGDDLVPDYITSVKEGAFYGWPYSYYGQYVDPAHVGEKPELVKTAIAPDVPMGAHVAALGLAFYTGNQFPQRYRNGAFVGEHGSWNRSKANGYKVAFVPFQNGKPGTPEDFLTGFVISDGSKGPQDPITVWGRPVGVIVARDGSMLVADPEGDRIWRISYSK